MKKVPAWARDIRSLWTIGPFNRRVADVADDVLHAVEAGIKRVHRTNPARADARELWALTEALALAVRVGLLARGVRVEFGDGVEPLVNREGKDLAALLTWDDERKPKTSREVQGRRVV